MIKRIIFFLAIIISGLGFLLIFESNSKSADEYKNSGILKTDKSFIPEESVAQVPFPDKISFCGEAVPLDELYTRERLERELIVTKFYHSNSILVLKRANRYFPIIEKILSEEALPDDFKYLCVIESNLDTRAISPAGAAGFWQFLKETAKQYELEVSVEIDERYNIEKSTRAAAKYLKEAYGKYGSWTLAAASYNGGMNRITQQSDRQNAETFYQMLLPEETTRYIYRILASKIFFNNPTAFGFYLKTEDFYPQIPTKEVEISSSVSNFAEYAELHKMNYLTFKELNPWLRENYLTNKTGKKYKVLIPEDPYLKVKKHPIKIHNSNWVALP